MPVSVTQISKTLDATGELIYDAGDDFNGCSTYEVEKVSGDDVLVCVEGVHAESASVAGPFAPVSTSKQFCAHGDRITKVYAKSAGTSSTINATPLSRNSPRY
jgi:hypothetical protein